MVSPLITPSITGNNSSFLYQDSFEPLPISSNQILLRDPALEVESVLEDDEEFNYPTAMAFLGPDDILVAEKDTGQVRRVINGEIQDTPVIDVQVANNNGTNERGLLGMAMLKYGGTTYVFLYFTESGGGLDGDDSLGVVPAGNRLYRYEFVGDENGGRLINPELLLDLPARPGPRYNGGPLLISYIINNTINSDDPTLKTPVIYLMIGDLDHRRSQSENYEGPPPDGTGGILAIDIDGNPLPDPPLGSSDDESDMREYYYAYGIRNSFGLDIDPVTGNLWDTENGPDYGDEINLVEPGFNSGWADVQGLASSEENEAIEIDEDLEDFDERGRYSDPEFVWQDPVGVTAIKFLNSTALGERYENDLFVGDINDGILYHFDLTEDRTELILEGPLADKVADNDTELAGVVFGTGFRSITDIEVGPDGYLYLLLYGGDLLRITPRGEDES
ncbi:MAG TPA: PQQ-dependent sugar dehydrogenase [Nitrososphaera sp.]|nr:PQQ-dependent sugar dehydrogenase [Nitrososphaera sp.]